MASPYPIIISAEVHCSAQQQKVLVDVLKEVFGDALVTAPVGAMEEWQEETLPSPEQLKYRIMFKVMPLDSNTSPFLKCFIMPKLEVKTRERHQAASSVRSQETAYIIFHRIHYRI